MAIVVCDEKQNSNWFTEQGSKFTVANVQFATGSRTLKNSLGANLLLQLLAHFRNKYMLCSSLDQIYSKHFGPRSRIAPGKKKINFKACQ